jgi:hypothetical protein
MGYSRKIGRYSYEWSSETLESFKGEITLVSINRVSTDTVIGFIRDTLDYRLALFKEIPSRGGKDYPIVLLTLEGDYEVIRGHNTVVWHIHNGSNGLACHVFTEEDLVRLPHLKTQDWQCITVT